MGRLRKVANRLPYIQRSVDALHLVRSRPGHTPGHYYSPIPAVSDLRERQGVIWPERQPRSLSGIDLREDEQLELLEQLAGYHDDQPYSESADSKLRYAVANDYFSQADAVVLHCLMRHLKPARIIEIGCGFSSAVMLDTSEYFLDGSVDFTFVEPHPERLFRLLKTDDRQQIRLLLSRVQDVDPAIFDGLSTGDILFVDSSHVAKTGSDLNTLLFEILPRLPVGVWIHFHDIFFPFEYPREYCLDKHWAWNEAYMLRAFLQYNSEFIVRLFPSFLEAFHPTTLERSLPTAMRSPMSWPSIRGASLWLCRASR